MKENAQLKRDPVSTEPTCEIIAYQIEEDDVAPIRPAPRERKWIEDAYEKFPYRCLPLVIANQYGWEVLSTHHVRAKWDGTSEPEGVTVEILYGDGEVHCHSHFGEGVVTFQIPYIFRTPANWNLMVRGPTNSPKDGIVALDGIVETDWAHATSTMNWRFTRAGTVEFALGEPICLFFPILRGALESFRGEFQMLESEPSLHTKFRGWSDSRDRFLSGLDKEKPEIVAEGWQKDYLRAARAKKSMAHPFVDKRPAEAKQSDNHSRSNTL